MQEEICAFARKPQNNVTGREFPRRPSEYVYVQKEHPKQRGNDTWEKKKQCGEDATGEAIKKEKELRTAYCASASLQRREEIPVASDGRSEKGAAPGREEENGRGEGHENATKYKGKESKNSAVVHTLWTKEAMVLRRASVFCCIVRLAKQREGLGVQSLADLSNLHLSGCRAFVFDGLKRFQDCPLSRTVVRDAIRVGTPELQRNNGQCEHM